MGLEQSCAVMRLVIPINLLGPWGVDLVVRRPASTWPTGIFRSGKAGRHARGCVAVHQHEVRFYFSENTLQSSDDSCGKVIL